MIDLTMVLLGIWCNDILTNSMTTYYIILSRVGIELSELVQFLLALVHRSEYLNAEFEMILREAKLRTSNNV